MQPLRIYRVRVPLLGRLAIVRDNGEAHVAGGLLCGTHLEALWFRQGKLYEKCSLGSGVITVTFCNTLVTDAVTGSSVVPTLARFKFHDSGTGSTAATDTQTDLVTAAGPATRATGTLSSAQTATGSNHAAQLLNSATTSYSGTLSIVEWGLFDNASQGAGNMADRRAFASIAVSNGDAITWNWTLSLPSNA